LDNRTVLQEREIVRVESMHTNFVFMRAVAKRSKPATDTRVCSIMLTPLTFIHIARLEFRASKLPHLLLPHLQWAVRRASSGKQQPFSSTMSVW
jgi:hypothetical protein